MPSKKRLLLLESPTACVFCGKDENNEFLYGKFFHLKTLSVHQNCLFFASGLSQRGRKESDGILGFLISDIQKEVRRGKMLKCFYCKRNGATVGCCKNICRRTFHFPCGIQNQTLHQFFGSFSSFCQLHRPVQKFIEMPEEELYCHICFLPLSEDNMNSYLYSTCCNHNLFHQSCLQKYALSAGRHFFKCPMCNNSTNFMKEMEFYGICVPEKDASWELEENAYQDLLYRPECGAPDCRCPEGRKFNQESAWLLLPCSNCGADARHHKCAKLKASETTWTCNECKVLEEQILKKRMDPQDSPKETDSINHLDSVNQQIPTLEMQSTVIEPSCSNIRPDTMPSLIAETENVQSPSVVNVPSPSTSYKFKEAPPNILSSLKVSLNDSNTFECKAMKDIKCKSLKREISPQEPNSNNQKMLSMNNIFNQIKTENVKNNMQMILNCKPIKTSTSTRQSKGIVKKRKANKKFNSGCCSGDPQKCIKRMFGLQCQNFRI